MGIMEEFRAAEGAWSEGLDVVREIAALGHAFTATAKGHRDDLRAASDALLGGAGGLVAKLKAAAEAPRSEGDGSQFLGRGVG